MKYLILCAVLFSGISYAEEKIEEKKYAIMIDIISDALVHKVDDDGETNLNDEYQKAVNDSVKFWDKVKDFLGL